MYAIVKKVNFRDATDINKVFITKQSFLTESGEEGDIIVENDNAYMILATNIGLFRLAQIAAINKIYDLKKDGEITEEQRDEWSLEIMSMLAKRVKLK